MNSTAEVDNNTIKRKINETEIEKESEHKVVKGPEGKPKKTKPNIVEEVKASDSDKPVIDSPSNLKINGIALNYTPGLKPSGLGLFSSESLKQADEPVSSLFAIKGSGKLSDSLSTESENIFGGSSVKSGKINSGESIFGSTTGVKSTGSIFGSAFGAGVNNNTETAENNFSELLNSNVKTNKAEEDSETLENDNFKPVVQLEKLNEIISGEEDEETLLSFRCKLFGFDDTLKSWKERGVGMFKLNKRKWAANKEKSISIDKDAVEKDAENDVEEKGTVEKDGKKNEATENKNIVKSQNNAENYRFLMRTEKINRLILNVKVIKGKMKFSSLNEKSFSFVGWEEQEKRMKFLVLFNNPASKTESLQKLEKILE
ncbi:Nuclear pore complex protein Nup98-Nup96 [Clydaea vesicula]|uniref:Nuclear pore complex protein Nup98-Nup96 n=1 Tax=Clydaea vesicula TaxID=447962 RepID=A0AAD5Y3H5_9FUNG|nr:Nuclear pore complex protein Nup98-Nup96 [Clydaea vesicula]KAJ3393958.1 Nuclear pore complex protein Nup98-Nup96 [Lobulomyces angularis]